MLKKDFILESGKKFGPITLCFETYGNLNEDRNNCILITHALTGDSHIARHSSGWWFYGRNANTYLYITRAMDLFDLKRDYGSYEKAVGSIKAKYLLAAISSDALFHISELRRTRDILNLSGVDLEYYEVQSNYGHDSFLLEQEKYREFLCTFLDNIYSRCNAKKQWRKLDYTFGNL